MTEKQDQPSAQKHPPSEIVAVVQDVMDRHDIPAVSSREVSKNLEFNDDYTTTKLNELVDDGLLKSYRTGAGFIYWVPENGEEGGEVDVSSAGSDQVIAENLDPSEIPMDLSQEIAEANLPEFQDNTWWQNQYETGYNMLQTGGVGFGLGLGILLANGPLMENVSVPELVFQSAAILFMFSGIALFSASLLMLSSYIGQQAAEQGWIPANPSIPW